MIPHGDSIFFPCPTLATRRKNTSIYFRVLVKQDRAIWRFAAREYRNQVFSRVMLWFCYGKPLFILIDFRRYLQTLLFVLLFDHIFPEPKGALRKRTGTREVKTLHYHMRMLDFALPTEVLASQLVHKGDL